MHQYNGNAASAVGMQHDQTIAYAFLFPESGTAPDPLEARCRLAAELYNLAVTKGLTRPNQEKIVIENKTVSLPFGYLKLEVNPEEFLWGGYRFQRFVPVGEFGVRGLRNRYRQAGIGAPLAAELAPDESNPGRQSSSQTHPAADESPGYGIHSLIRTAPGPHRWSACGQVGALPGRRAFHGAGGRS